jgi:hypothetical protein
VLGKVHALKFFPKLFTVLTHFISDVLLELLLPGERLFLRLEGDGEGFPLALELVQVNKF